MATVKFLGSAADMMSGTIFLAQHYGLQTKTVFEVLDRYGTPLQVFYGRDFSYDFGGFVSLGGIDRYDLFRTDGSLASIWDNLAISAGEYRSVTTPGQSAAALVDLILRDNDTIVGTAFADRLRASPGQDLIDGGLGHDAYSAADLAASITIDLAAGTAQSFLGNATLVGIEGAEGSAFSDTLRGNAGSNTFQGFGGNDLIDGRAGADTAVYRDATSAVTVNLELGQGTGGSGSDQLVSIENAIGSRFGDTITGNAFSNRLDGFLGNDLIDGAGGADTVDYQLAYNSVSVNLAGKAASGAHGADTLRNIENAIGSQFSDRLIGDGRANDLSGLGGNDTFFAGAGNDRLTGGLGDDQFVFHSALSSSTNVDRIVDFHVANDTIQLENSTFTALTTTGRLLSTAFHVGAAAHDPTDRIIYNSATGDLLYDSNGSAAGGSTRFAKLEAGLAMTSADFLVT